MTLAQENLEAYQSCYQRAANKLHHVSRHHWPCSVCKPHG